MYIAFDHPSLASSGGATYECLYVAPELARCGRTISINIPRLWRSGPITLIPMTFYLHTLQISERRSELDLQINMLAEQKASKTIELLDHVIEQLNGMNNSFYMPRDDEAYALEVSPTPEEVVEGIKEPEVEGGKKQGKATAGNANRKESKQEKIK
jgi:hypothetical protein